MLDIKQMEHEQTKKRAEQGAKTRASEAVALERRRAQKEKARKQKLVDEEMERAAVRQAEENAAKLAAIEAKEAAEKAEEEAAKARAAAAASESATAWVQYQQQMGAYSAVMAAAEAEGKRRAREAFFTSPPSLE